MRLQDGRVDQWLVVTSMSECRWCDRVPGEHPNEVCQTFELSPSEQDSVLFPGAFSLKPGMLLGPRVPGYNVDPVDVAAGLRELNTIGYTGPHTVMVIEYALQRWARGEEDDAERGAIDLAFYGIDFGSWRRVLAAAIVAGRGKLGVE